MVIRLMVHRGQRLRWPGGSLLARAAGASESPGGERVVPSWRVPMVLNIKPWVLTMCPGETKGKSPFLFIFKSWFKLHLVVQASFKSWFSCSYLWSSSILLVLAPSSDWQMAMHMSNPAPHLVEGLSPTLCPISPLSCMTVWFVRLCAWYRNLVWSSTGEFWGETATIPRWFWGVHN